MKVRVMIDEPGYKLNEVFEGATPEAVCAAVKTRITAALPLPLRMAGRAMSDVAFWQEVVRRYNAAKQRNVPLPKSCAEFLQLAEQEGIARQE